MRYGPHSSPGRVDTGYVSEFTDFITHFLEEHPEEEKERHKGWYLYWDHRVDPKAIDEAEKDRVPDDRYGFDYSAWRHADDRKSVEPKR